MADIFISYKKEDAGRVIRLVEGLRDEGFSVWWDLGIQAGSEWDRTIRQELDAARLVIAIWSEASVHAPWVKEEANVGKTRGVLLPVKIDEVDPPLGFTLIQAADLVGWRGDRKDKRWNFLLDAVRNVLRGEKPRGIEGPLTQRHRPTKRSMLLPAAGGALALLLVGAVVAIPLYMRGQDSRPAAVAPAAPAAPAAPPAAPASPPAPTISPGEQQLWDKAMEEKSRQGFQSYLLSYPNGAFAQRARDILLTCRTETQEVWKPGPAIANQMVRGVGDTSKGLTPAQACAKAKSDIQSQAKLMCETIVTNGGFRNAKWTVKDTDCNCKQTSPAVTVCIADLPYSCLWEQKMVERLEICG
jgi:hypothetical protein